jgi:class 3 adenylate cyclase
MATCSRCGAASGEEARFCATCGGPLTGPPEREARKVVTILFSDLVESTKLAERFDPEALQRLLAPYFVGARTIVERHGGTVQKFIGDAVYAVFGMPAVREDDALRGVRAAVELRDAVVSLDAQLGSPGLATRIGVNTGEVFAAGTDLSVAGDAVCRRATSPSRLSITRPSIRDNTIWRSAVEARRSRSEARRSRSQF